MLLIVELPPLLDQDFGFSQAQKNLTVQAFISKSRSATKPSSEPAGNCEIPKMRIHDLRHLFATRCIESGVDIPTVSKWLGHKDGGALAMRTYGHLRNEHSQKMAKKVKF